MQGEEIQIAYAKAVECQNQGDFAGAEKILLELLPHIAHVPEIYISLGNVYLMQQKNEQALSILEQGNQAVPDNILLIATYSPLLAHMGQQDRALELSQQLIAKHPESAKAHFSLAAIYFSSQKLEQALMSARQGFELDDQSVDTLYLYGTILQSNQLKEEALEIFQRCISIAPDWVMSYISAGCLLEELDKIEQAKKLFEQVAAKQPGYADAYKRLGMLHMKEGDLTQAESYLKQALERNSDDAQVHLCLSHIYRDQGNFDQAITHHGTALALNPALNKADEYAKTIPQWHFDMLADTARNEAYEQAIINSVKPEQKILEIGTGSGLLSMMAVRAGATQVTTCELVPELAEIAEQIIADNGYQHQIKVVNKRSNELKVGPGLDLEEKADLLISEILDAGLLGEHVLPSLRHAREYLLKPGAKILPYHADIHAVAIESETIRLANPIKKISGFDLSRFNIFKTITPYNAIQLDNTPHRKMSEPFFADRIDFNNLPEEKTGRYYNAKTLSVTINHTGNIDVVAFWFVLNVDDKVSISTAPDGDTLHWRQAVAILPESVAVTEGDVIELELRQNEQVMTFKLL